MLQTQFPLVSFWQKLITPHKNIVDIHRQRRIRILSGISLTLFIVGSLGVISSFFESGFNISIIGPIIFLIGYLLTRTPWPESGGLLITLGYALAISLYIILAVEPTDRLIVTLLFPVLLSMVVFRARVTAIIGLIIAGVCLILFFVRADVMGDGLSTVVSTIAGIAFNSWNSSSSST